ncbi:MAG: T9SS type A sorting domain-containing protein, partial [Aureispira sp.]
VIAQNNVGSLPIELVSFEAERNTRQEVQLRWTTAMELNNKGFEVERMLEGETEFIKVAYVEGQGTSSGLHSYYQIDPNSFTNVSYYRLKQIDFDGTFSYSPTRAVEGMANPDGTGMSVFPNPTQGALNIQILDPIAPQKVYITLTDVQGRIVREHSTTISNERIIQLPQLLENLSNNLYFLHVQTVDGKKHWSQKISLQ